MIPTDSQDPAAWKLALGYAQAIGSKAEPSVQDYVLLTHTKAQLRHTSLAAHLGEAVVKALNAGRTVNMPAGGLLRHATLQTLGNLPRGAVIIAYYAEDRMLERLDGTTGLVGIVAVSDIAGQAEGWIERWNPLVHGRPAAPMAMLIKDAVVEKALAMLTRGINLAHGTLHPRDKEHVDETLRILRANGHILEPAEMRSWAIRNDWKPGAAEELAKLAQRIAGLKNRPSLAKLHNAHGRYQSWSE